MERDFLSDMAKKITDAIPDEGEFKAMDVAEKVLLEVEQHDPELLTGWLKAQALSIISNQVTMRRGYLVRQATRQKPTKFQEAAKKFEETGEEEPLSVFTQTIAVSSDNLVRRVGRLTKADCTWISDQRTKAAKTLAFEGAFYAAVAKKIPDGKVLEDVMTEVEFLQLREGLKL